MADILSILTIGGIICFILVTGLVWIFFKAINSDNSHNSYHMESWADMRYRAKLERQLRK